MADRKRTDCHFTVGDQVLLKLQPYTQSTVANRPFPKLAYKYFGPYTVLERVGSVAYKLDLPEGHMIHPVFHISQLKPFVPDCTPLFDTLPVTTDLEAAAAVPNKIIDKQFLKSRFSGLVCINPPQHGRIIMFCGNVFLMLQLGDKLHLRRGKVSQVTQRDTKASSY